MDEIVNKLLSHKIISNIIGNVPKNISPCLIVWARKTPKPQFNAFIELAKLLSSEQLKIYIDDTCSKVIMNRDDNEQNALNDLYTSFFKERNCKVYFSSKIYKDLFGKEFIAEIFALGTRINTSDFLSCLPLKKRLNLNQYTGVEFLHLIFELLIFEQAEKTSNTILIGNFSQAIISLEHKISNTPLTAIVIPKLEDETSIEEYIKKLNFFQSQL